MDDKESQWQFVEQNFLMFGLLKQLLFYSDTNGNGIGDECDDDKGLVQQKV